MENINDHRAVSSKQPIFILSCARSGSTMLRCIIDTHPNLCSPSHLHLGPLCADLYKTTYFSLGQLPNITTEEQREQLAITETRRVVADLLDRYAQGKGKKNWCEKSTINIEYLDILVKVFPDAKYICLFRNCLDVVHSCIKISPFGFMPELAPYIRKQPGNFVAAMIDNWLERSNILIAFEQAHAGQCFRVNYESLVQQPEHVLPKLFDFLGEPWDEKLIDSVFQVPHDLGDGDPKVWFSGGINKDSVGNGTSIPLAALPHELIPDIDVLHQKLGYPSLESLYAERPEKDESTEQLMDLDDFFRNRLMRQASAKLDKLTRLHGVCTLVVTGSKGGVWVIGSDASGLSIKEDNELSDCTISTTYSVFRELIEGRRTAVNAYEQGEIWGDGNTQLALAFGRLLFGEVL
ncbi:MAG: sulfotransferase [Methylobacter sp.]